VLLVVAVTVNKDGFKSVLGSREPLRHSTKKDLISNSLIVHIARTVLCLITSGLIFEIKVIKRYGISIKRNGLLNST
jgi:hypothetical protein